MWRHVSANGFLQYTVFICYRFLHASLQMAALQECASLHDVKESLAHFPAHIEDAYIQTWKRILRQPQSEVVQDCLLWVLCAARSMTVDELQHAIATSPKTRHFDPDRLVPVDTLVALSSGLLVVDEKTRLVRLVRKSPLA